MFILLEDTDKTLRSDREPTGHLVLSEVDAARWVSFAPKWRAYQRVEVVKVIAADEPSIPYAAPATVIALASRGLNPHHRLALAITMLETIESTTDDAREWLSIASTHLDELNLSGDVADVSTDDVEHVLTVLYGIDSGATLIPAGKTARIEVTPQKDHVLDQLMVSSSIAENFELLKIEIEDEPLTIDPLDIRPGEHPTWRTECREVRAGQTVALTVRALRESRFTATVRGEAIVDGAALRKRRMDDEPPTSPESGGEGGA